MSTAVAKLIDLIVEKGYPITTAANLANKKALDSVGALIEGTK